MILNCMIVDDEMMARKSLERFCKKHDSLNVTSICENAKKALEVLKKEEIDLIFLDVEMPELTGLEFLEQAVVLPQVILTTSKTEYAYDAYQHQVADYLKKPFNFIRFQQAVAKVLEIHKMNTDYKAEANEIYVREDGRYVRIPYDDILYFENAGDYVSIKTTENSHIIHGTMKGIDTRLNHPKFLKVHRSFIVNMSKIKDIEDTTLVIDKKVIPISRAHRQALMGRLNLL